MLDSAFFPGGGTPKVWASGMTVAQYDCVVSPADRELYQRITATGSGTTDPADDVINYVARSYARTNAIQTPGLLANGSPVASTMFNGATKTSLTPSPGVRAKVLGLTGRGSINFLGLAQTDSGSVTNTVEIVIDGRTVLNTGALSFGAGGVGVCLIGSTGFGYPSSANCPLYSALKVGDIKFRRSADVYVTASTSAAHVLAHAFTSEA